MKYTCKNYKTLSYDLAQHSGRNTPNTVVTISDTCNSAFTSQFLRFMNISQCCTKHRGKTTLNHHWQNYYMGIMHVAHKLGVRAWSNLWQKWDVYWFDVTYCAHILLHLRAVDVKRPKKNFKALKTYKVMLMKTFINVEKNLTNNVLAKCMPCTWIGVARGCSGRTCTPQGGEKFFQASFTGKMCKCTPAGHEVHPPATARVNF